MTRSRWLSLSTLAAAALLAWAGSARAGDEAPAAKPATPAPAAAEAPKPATDAAATKTPSPVVSVLMWVGKQVAPSLECACPGTPEGETAWRAWFTGGKDVPLAGLRDALVADGWTADRTVAFFREMRAKMAASGTASDEGKCAGKCAGKCEGKCEGKCHGDCPGCKKSGTEAAQPETPPTPAPSKP